MSLSKSEKEKLKRYKLEGLNKPKKTPSHPTKKGAKGPSSAAYWANKLFWSGSEGSKKSPPKSQKKKYV